MKKYAILQKVGGGRRRFFVAYLDGATKGGGPIYQMVKGNLTQAEATTLLRELEAAKNPRRSTRGLKVSRGDLGPQNRCVSCYRKLGQLHGPNCKIAKSADFPITLIGDSGHSAKQREAVRRLTRRGKKNPVLGVFGANPKARVVRELGRVVEVRYKRKDDGGLYFHKYSSKPRLLALSDGSIWIKGA